MTLYVALIAAINLGLGYVLAVYLGGAARRAPQAAATGGLSAVPATLPPGVTYPAAGSGSIEMPVANLQGANLQGATHSAREAAPARATELAPTPVVESETLTVPTSGAHDEADSTGDELSDEDDVDLDDFRAGLAAFQAQLTEVDRQLTTSTEDEVVEKQTIENCMDQVSHASSEYIGQANEASKQLSPADGDSAAVAEEKRQLQQTIIEQANFVQQRSDELDSLVVDEDVAAARQAVMDASVGLAGAAEGLKTKIDHASPQLGAVAESSTDPDAVPGAATPPRDALTGLFLREYTEDTVARCCAEPADGTLMVALITIDQIEAIIEQYGQSISDRLLACVARVAQESLESPQTAARYGSHEIAILSPRTDLDRITQTVERIRQHVEAATFTADDVSLTATLSLGIADAGGVETVEGLFGQIEEAVTEARRYGSNRTFWHDGKFPTPVVPSDLQVASEVLAI